MTQQTLGAFWDERYIERGVAFGDAPNVFLASQAGWLSRGQHVLVPGDGDGRNGVWLAEQGLVVHTIDASPAGVAHALSRAAQRGVTISAEVGDLATWAWPVAKYDAVVSIFLHFQPAIRTMLHRRMLAALKPGGLVILEAYAPDQLEYRKSGSVGGPLDLAMLFTPDLLRTDFGEAEIIDLVETEAILSEGTRHRGLSSVVRLIARRRA